MNENNQTQFLVVFAVVAGIAAYFAINKAANGLKAAATAGFDVVTGAAAGATSFLMDDILRANKVDKVCDTFSLDCTPAAAVGLAANSLQGAASSATNAVTNFFSSTTPARLDDDAIARANAEAQKRYVQG